MEGEEDMIKLFVSDLDDTLVYNVNDMQKEDERAICWLAEKGTNICFASGRFTHRIDEVVNRFAFPYYTTSLNGATMLLPDGKIFHESSFEDGVARKYIDISIKGTSRYCLCK